MAKGLKWGAMRSEGQGKRGPHLVSRVLRAVPSPAVFYFKNKEVGGEVDAYRLFLSQTPEHLRTMSFRPLVSLPPKDFSFEVLQRL